MTIRDSILTTLSPLTLQIGRVNLPVNSRDMTPANANRVIGLAKPGDTLLAYKKWVLSNALIPGEWKHAAMVVSGSELVEAVGTGVRRQPLYDWCLDHDRVALLGPEFANENGEDGVLAAGFIMTLVGMPYDETFEFHEARNLNTGFYCSKAVWWSWDQVMLAAGKPSPFHPKLNLGVEVEMPIDISKEPNWRVKWVKQP